MVWTIYINENGGIEFQNGSLKMIGTKNKLDKEEKLQSLRLRFLTQLGENNWAPGEGFDYEGILGQFPISEEYMDITKEKIMRVNCIKTLAQDPQISKFVDYINVETDEEDNEIIAHLTCHTIEGEKIEGDLKLGRDFIA